MRIFLICPVRTPDDKDFADWVVDRLERRGHTVHYPPRDVDQTDDGVGLEICRAHRKAMLAADEILVIWNPESTGSHFDLGSAFMLQAFKEVPIRIARVFDSTPHKSYGNVLKALDDLASRTCVACGKPLTAARPHQGPDGHLPARDKEELQRVNKMDLHEFHEYAKKEGVFGSQWGA